MDGQRDRGKRNNHLKELVSNLNSSYLQAANQLQRRQKKRVVAYVESYDDIFFWRHVLSEFEGPELEFEVMLPSRTNLSRGKKTVLTNSLGAQLGEYMIACVDADVDYLLQGRTNHSQAMLDNPYVVHTYAYSIESLQCYAPSLHNVCVMATLNDHDIFDFESYLQEYSRAVYELFVWAIWLYRQARFTEFPLTTLNNFISIDKVNLYKPQDAIAKTRHQVNRKVAWMQQHHPEARGKIKPLKAELEQLGVRPDNVYLYIQGHHLMDNVAGPVLDSVCTLLRREREREIKRLSGGHKQQMDNELACYQHSQCPVDAMIRRNTQFADCPAYQQIRQHVANLVSELKKK
jgi:hypothetical protein